MNDKPALQASFLSPTMRCVWGTVCVLIVLLLLAGAISIPFMYESQSIRYKFGIDKTLLRTGKVLGMIAAVLLLLQLLLSARFKLLDKIFGLNKLYFIHRVSAICIVVMAVLHPLFVFAPEDITSLPIELKFWPEIIGGILLLSICFITATGLWRKFLGLPFHLWWLAHRAATFTAVVMLFVHVLFASDSFEQGLPRLVVIIAAILYTLVFCWVKTKPFLLRKKPYSIQDITTPAQNTYALNLVPQHGNVFQYLPGQFGFITVNSETIAAEEHPFTISSAPTRPGALQFSIRSSGDWTKGLGRLKPGDTAVVDGPYGIFSHLAHAQGKEIIMIAGGIGITPMLSMLRYIADTQDKRKITLIWSNRTKADTVFEEEFKELEQTIPGLAMIDIFTQEHTESQDPARLDKRKLVALLKDCDRNAAVYICGPPLMMQELKRILIELGFRRKRIHTEEFAL